MNDQRTRDLPARVRDREITALQAWISICRRSADMKYARGVLGPKAIDEAGDIGAEERPVASHGAHVWLEKETAWKYDHDPEWIAVRNRLRTIEAAMREAATEPEATRAPALRAPERLVLHVYLHGLPKFWRRG